MFRKITPSPKKIFKEEGIVLFENGLRLRALTIRRLNYPESVVVEVDESTSEIAISLPQGEDGHKLSAPTSSKLKVNLACREITKLLPLGFYLRTKEENGRQIFRHINHIQ